MHIRLWVTIFPQVTTEGMMLRAPCFSLLCFYCHSLTSALSKWETMGNEKKRNAGKADTARSRCGPAVHQYHICFSAKLSQHCMIDLLLSFTKKHQSYHSCLRLYKENCAFRVVNKNTLISKNTLTFKEITIKMTKL